MEKNQRKHSNSKLSRHHYLKRNITLIDKIASEDNANKNFFSFLEEQNSNNTASVPTQNLRKNKLNNSFNFPSNNDSGIRFKCSPLVKKHSRVLQSKIKIAQLINHHYQEDFQEIVEKPIMSEKEFKEIHHRINSLKFEENEPVTQLKLDNENIINLTSNTPEYFVIFLRGFRSPINFKFHDLNTNSLCIYLSKLKKPDANQYFHSIKCIEPFHSYSVDMGLKKYRLFPFSKLFLSIINDKNTSISFRLTSGYIRPNARKPVAKPFDITTTLKKLLKLSNNPEYDDIDILGLTQFFPQTSKNNKKNKRSVDLITDGILKRNIDAKKSYSEFMNYRTQLLINDKNRMLDAKHRREKSVINNLARKTVLMKKMELVRKEVQ